MQIRLLCKLCKLGNYANEVRRNGEAQGQGSGVLEGWRVLGGVCARNHPIFVGEVEGFGRRFVPEPPSFYL